MPRDIPVGNGQMLVTFDHLYQIRDLYFPHVGQENHAGNGPCRFGVWSPLPNGGPRNGERRRRRLYWSDQDWHIDLRYQHDTLATDARLRHEELHLELHCTDVVDFHRPVLVRRIEVHNLTDRNREVHLFHHNDFHMYGTRVGDTVFYDPQRRALIHYRGNRHLMATWYVHGEPRIDQFATGTAGFHGAEGTWRDAEDGVLGNNAIAQGAVDSTMMLRTQLPASERRVVYLVIGAGRSQQDIADLHKFLHREGPQRVIERTMSYWRLWVDATPTDPAPVAPAPTDDDEQDSPLPSQHAADLFKRSLLIVRTQIDNNGAIIAANDSDIMQYARDTYSYLWPRDGALVAAALDDAGFPSVTRAFYALCSKIIHDDGYFLHKYNPDGSVASSWHPWVNHGQPQLPIQEDETALVIWALWRHYHRHRDIEFVRPLWGNLIVRAADFLVRFRDPATDLPLPCYDLWEERWGIHAFTVATVYGGLHAAEQFAICFGDKRRATVYRRAADQVRDAFCKHFWSHENQRFHRRLIPTDRDRVARMMADLVNGRPLRHDPDPANDDAPHHTDQEQPQPTQDNVAYEHDTVIDSSIYAVFAMGMLDPKDDRVQKTMAAIRSSLWVQTPIGGAARYQNDGYQRVAGDPDTVPGNPWFICTLWLADWHIAKAANLQELQEALPILEWVAQRALASGVLAEQADPFTGAPLSVSPLTWSHATFVSTFAAYIDKLKAMRSCPTCGRPAPNQEPARTAPEKAPVRG